MLTNDYRIILPHSGKVTLFIFGDMQFGATGFNEEMWQEFEHDFKTTKNAFAIGLGDYDDFVRFTVRKPMVIATHGDASARNQLDQMVFMKMNRLIKKLEFMKGRIVGMHCGHHEWDFISGQNTTQLLCHDLKCAYLDWTAYTVLKFSTKAKGPSSSAAMKIWSTHGSGGGSYSSTDLGVLEKRIAPYWVSDLYLRGHSSKLEMIPTELNDVTVKGPGRPKIIKKTRWLVNCGGFMSGYHAGPAGYVESKGLPPACLGWAKVEIQFANTIRDIQGKRHTGLKIQPTLCSPSVVGGLSE